MNIIDPNGRKIVKNLIRILESSANEDRERVNHLGDETYFLLLDKCNRESRLAAELEEVISMKDLSADHLKYFFESIILSLREGVKDKYRLLKVYEKIQQKYGITNAPE
jgi:hypothetical protein